MIIKTIRILFIILCIVVFGYLALPDYNFPAPPPDAVQSKEPADTETPLRRAYFTDMTRAEVLNWYKNQMSRSSFMNLPMPTYLLNYPPEDAQTIIRDQTRSTFLEEVVHPMRESVYVNGYEPPAKDEKNAINIDGRHWRQKITVRIIPSSVYVRLGVFAGIIIVVVLLFNFWTKTIKDLAKEKWRIW